MHNSPSFRFRLGIFLLVAAIIGALSFHFAMTVLYLLPLNPVRLAHGSVVEAYMHPYFRQRWSLFAPDPPLDNKILTLRCRLEEPQGEVETKWHDLDSMVLEARRKHLLSPAERLGRVHRAVLAAALGTREDAVELFRAQMKKKFPNAEALGDAMEEADGGDDAHRYAQVAQALAERRTQELKAMSPFIDRVGTSFCAAFYGGARIKASQFRVVVHEFPRYSERAQADDFGAKKAVTLPWGMATPDVAPLRL